LAVEVALMVPVLLGAVAADILEAEVVVDIITLLGAVPAVEVLIYHRVQLIPLQHKD
jgi:hypothetical protein